MNFLHVFGNSCLVDGKIVFAGHRRMGGKAQMVQSDFIGAFHDKLHRFLAVTISTMSVVVAFHLSQIFGKGTENIAEKW